MKRLNRTRMNLLSKVVFGTSSKWYKMVTYGFPETFERNREVMVPDGRGGMKSKTFTDKKTVLKHFTVKEIRREMFKELKRRKAEKLKAAV